MPYTAIIDKDEVEKALKKLKDAFLVGAERNGESFGEHRYLHRNKDELWGAIGRQKDWRKRCAHFIGFGRGESTITVFEVNPPKEGDDGNKGEGLFVQDDRGNRYLTHSGNLSLSKKSPRSEKNVRDQLMDFTGLDCWIDVTGIRNRRFLVASLDSGGPSVLIDRIDQVTKVIESFKKTDDEVCPLKLDQVTTEDPSTRMASSALNTILYGPPGTGKTYATFRRCVEICDGKEKCPDEDDKVRARYADLVKEGRIEFVTFHQSYGYEEFVEGLRPDTGSTEEGEEAGAGFRLVATAGVLKRIAKRACIDLSKLQVFKMGLGNPDWEDEYQEIFDECIGDECVLLNYGEDVNWSNERFSSYDEIRRHWQEEKPDAQDNYSKTTIRYIDYLRNCMRMGDIVIVSATGRRFRAIGEVIGPYEFEQRDDGKYNHRRKVRWLWQDAEGKPACDICRVKLAQYAIYPLEQQNIHH